MAAADLIYILPKSGIAISDGPFWYIANRKTQGQLAKQNLDTNIPCHQTYRLPAKCGFQLAPFAGLQQMRVRMVSEKLVPVREGDNEHFRSQM